MDARTEPRLKTETAASITVLRDDKTWELPCLIVDVSGMGYGLTMQESLKPGETIRLQIGLDHVLAVVRFCRSMGDAYTVGVERVDEWLVAPKIPPARADQTSDPESRILGRPQINRLDRLRTIATRQLFMAAEPKKVSKDGTSNNKKKQLPLAAAVGAGLAIAILAIYFAGGPKMIRLGAAVVSSVAGKKHAAQSPAKPASQPASAQPSPNLAAATQPANTQQVASVAPTSVVAPQTAAPPVSKIVAPTASTPAMQNPASQVPAKPAAGAQHQILIEAHDRSWVVACADGKKVFEKLLTDQSAEKISFSRQALVHAGNSSKLDITVDSKPLGPMGKPGTIGAWRFSPDGHEDVPATLNRTCEIR
jgi:hypothetical protein